MRKFEREQKLPQCRLAIKEIPLDPDKQKQDWDVVYVPTGRVIDNILKVDKTRAQELLGHVARLHDFENADNLEIRSQGNAEPDSTASIQRKWDFVNRTNGSIIDTVDNADTAQAEAVRKNWVRRLGLADDEVGKRSVPTDASQQRYNDRQEPNPVSEQPPQGFQTQRPATGDYYEVRGGNDRVYGYISSDAGRAPGGMGLAQTARQYVNNLTGGDNAYVQYRAGDPVQARASNGVPAWEIYERDSGHVINTIFDHDQTSAWQQAQRYLRDIGAEDPSLFSVRPKMEA